MTDGRNLGGEGSPAAADTVESLRARLAEAEATLDAIRDGLVDAVVVAGRDERQRVYTLESADLPYRHFLEHMAEGAVSLDSAGHIVFCNRFFAELVGRSRAAMTGASFREFVVPAATSAFDAAIRATEPIRIASEIIAADGRAIPVQLALTVTGREDDPRINIVVTDLSERERIRELRAARELAEAQSLAKDRFLAAVGHDLRSPLHVIIGWTALLRQGASALDPTAEKALDAIERNIRLQTKLLDDILDLSRHASGKLGIERAVVDLRELVLSAVEGLGVMAEKSGISLDVQADASVAVFGDAARLEQVLHNLVGNALKFTPPGGHVRVRLTPVDGRVRISVTDDGIGMAPDLVPRVFEPFRQATAGHTRHGGLGLGLAITKSLVELHDGRVWAQSEGSGKGSTFVVELPIATGVDLQASDPSPEDSVARSARLCGLRILVVDDESDTRDATSSLLRREGAEIVSAPDAASALAHLEKDRFDALVSDLMMPGTSGFDLAHALGERGMNGPFRLALTSLASDEARSRARDSGFDAYLTKPVDLDTLCRVLRERCR